MYSTFTMRAMNSICSIVSVISLALFMLENNLIFVEWKGMRVANRWIEVASIRNYTLPNRTFRHQLPIYCPTSWKRFLNT